MTFEGDNVARAKQTGRAEARRRYRQANSQPEAGDGEALDYGERKPEEGPARAAARPGRDGQSAPARPGFTSAFRAAYHPAHLREDIRALPVLVRSRAFLAAVGLVIAGAVSVFLFPGYTGTAFAWELLVLPGSALAPQLVAGFFAPRASYLLGFIVGIVQGLVFTLFITQFASRLGTTLPSDQMSNLFMLAFVTGPVSGTLFAAAAAWYKRFLALSSPRRGQAGRGQPSRASKGTPQKRAATQR
jgi:hypothetical protein